MELGHDMICPEPFDERFQGQHTKHDPFSGFVIFGLLNSNFKDLRFLSEFVCTLSVTYESSVWTLSFRVIYNLGRFHYPFRQN